MKVSSVQLLMHVGVPETAPQLKNWLSLVNTTLMISGREMQTNPELDKQKYFSLFKEKNCLQPIDWVNCNAKWLILEDGFVQFCDACVAALFLDYLDTL